MLEFNVELRDFRQCSTPWASDVFLNFRAGPLDDDDAVSWETNGYVGGWLSSDLKVFFSTVGLAYPQLEIDAIAHSGTAEELQVRGAKPAGRKPVDAFLAHRGYDFLTLEDWLKTLGKESEISRIGLALRFAFVELCGFIPLYHLDMAADATLPIRLKTLDAAATWSELLVGLAYDDMPDCFSGDGAADSWRWYGNIFLKNSDCAQFEQKSGLGTGFFKGADGEIESGKIDLAAARARIQTSELSGRDTAQTKPINNALRGLNEKELGTRERETLLNVIGVMLELLQSPNRLLKYLLRQRSS